MCCSYSHKHNHVPITWVYSLWVYDIHHSTHVFFYMYTCKTTTVHIYIYDQNEQITDYVCRENQWKLCSEWLLAFIQEMAVGNQLTSCTRKSIRENTRTWPSYFINKSCLLCLCPGIRAGWAPELGWHLSWSISQVEKWCKNKACRWRAIQWTSKVPLGNENLLFCSSIFDLLSAIFFSHSFKLRKKKKIQ